MQESAPYAEKLAVEMNEVMRLSQLNYVNRESGDVGMITYYTTCDSPFQTITLTSDGQSLTGLTMSAQKHARVVDDQWVHLDEIAPFKQVKEQLRAYFEGDLTAFDVPISLHGTPFQLKVWAELQHIGYGQTLAYGELANRIGDLNAMRAVGMAAGHNPIGIIVPCHRLVGAQGKLVGYAAGLERKASLLDFEKSVAARGPHKFAVQQHALFEGAL